MKKENIMKIIVFIVVLFIPIIYSFFYLKSYWDPYGDLTGINIALVNLDEGEDDQNQGKEFIEGLKDSGTFNICEVDKEQAQEGMENGNYYATITIPEDFTKCLNSASTTEKKTPTITYSPNQATNYLATQIINSGVKTMELNLEEKINSKIVETLADKLQEVPEKLQEISDGAGQILDGSESLNQGLAQIKDGTGALNESYTEFDKGVTSAATGSKTLEDGISKVNTGVQSLEVGAGSLDKAITQINQGTDELSKKGGEGITTLGTGIQQLYKGAENLNSGLNTYVEGTTNLANGTQDYIDGAQKYVGSVDTYIDSVNQLLQMVTAQTNDATTQAYVTKIKEAGAQIKAGGVGLTTSDTKIKTLQAGAKTLSTSGEALLGGMNELYTGTRKLYEGTSEISAITDGIQNLRTALAQVKDGTTTLKTGVTTLNAGTKELKTGSNNLTTGLQTLDSSSKQVKTALTTLEEGTKTAYDGSSELVSGVKTFRDEINNGMNDTNEQLESLDGIKEFAENPVEFKTEAYGEVNSYGIAFTPLFLSIGLWVGALMCYVVLYYDQKNRFGIFGSDSENKLLQNILYIAIGAVEGIITGALLQLGLGYEVQNVALYYFASALIGVTFISIIQCLIRNFGDVGKFIALIILVLQLAASGGTFPVETIAKGFRSITSFLPMTYTIKLLREVLVPTASNFKGMYIGILILITVVTLAITYTVDIIRKKHSEEN